MGALIVICSVILATVVVLLITAPLRTAQRAESPEAGEGAGDSPERAEGERRGDLEAAREAKYREIRDAELDYRTGKLSAQDYGAIDGQLRGEALVILNELEALGASAEDEPGGP